MVHNNYFRPTGISNRHFATKIEPTKVDTPATTKPTTSTMDYSKMTVKELTALCKEKGIKAYSGKKKADLVDMLSKSDAPPVSAPKIEAVTDVIIPPNTMTSATYASVLKDALEATSCDTACLEVLQGDVRPKDELDTLTTGSETSWSPLKAAVAAIVAKLAHPEWDTRKHQVAIGGKYSLRSVDAKHVSSTLFQKGLYNTATEFALTRSFEKAEPFNKSYSGNIKPDSCKVAFLNVVEIMNTTATPTLLKEMLVYVMLFLKEQKEKHTALQESVLESSKELSLSDVSDALGRINTLSGRGMSVVPVIAVHVLLTTVQPHLWPSMTVKPLKEHTAPDGHTDSYGDVEGLDPSKKPVLAIEIKDKLKIDDTIIASFNKKTAASDIPLKYILTTAVTQKYHAPNNISVQTVSDFITTHLQNALYYDPSICTVFIIELQKCVSAHTNLSLTNKEAVVSILKSLLA